MVGQPWAGRFDVHISTIIFIWDIIALKAYDVIILCIKWLGLGRHEREGRLKNDKYSIVNKHNNDGTMKL